MSAIPRYRPHSGPTILSAGFRPFFLLSALWSALAIPLWLAFLAGAATVPTALPAAVWHAHEMVFGFGAAAVAGFLLTAIPNWTGRMPLQGGPLALLVLLVLAGAAWSSAFGLFVLLYAGPLALPRVTARARGRSEDRAKGARQVLTARRSSSAAAALVSARRFDEAVAVAGSPPATLAETVKSGA